MRCETAFELISGHIDGQNTPAEEAALQAHLSECAACRSTLEAMLDLELQTGSLQAAPPPQLKQRILDAVREEAARKPEKPHKRWLGAVSGLVAVAAILALVLGTGLVKLPRFGSDYAPASTLKSVDIPLAATEAPALAEEELAADGVAEETALPEAPAETSAAAPEEAEAAAQTEAPYGNGLTAEIVSGSAGVPQSTEAAAETPVTRVQRRGKTADFVIAQEDKDYCDTLSQQDDAPVLIISGLDGQTFQEVFRAVTPEFSTLLEQAGFQLDGSRSLISVDFNTVAAIAEWLNLIVDEPGVASASDLPQADSGSVTIEGQLAEYDPELSCLRRICELPTAERLLSLHEQFIKLVGHACSWLLVYPSAEYTPQADHSAYIVLLPAAE